MFSYQEGNHQTYVDHETLQPAELDKNTKDANITTHT